jgi:hypothetical protein
VTKGLGRTSYNMILWWKETYEKLEKEREKGREGEERMEREMFLQS